MNTLGELEDLEWRLDSMESVGIETTITIKKAIELCRAVSANEVEAKKEEHKRVLQETARCYNDMEAKKDKEIEDLTAECIEKFAKIRLLEKNNEAAMKKFDELGKKMSEPKDDRYENFHSYIRDHVIVHGLEVDVIEFNNFHDLAGLE